MVTFKGWLIKTIKDNCCLLKIRRGNCEYSIPYERPTDDSFFDVHSNKLRLKNLVTNTIDEIDLEEIFNVEIYSINQYEISKQSMAKHIDGKYSPILSYNFKNLKRAEVFNLMFLDEMTLNYMKIMDFMEYNEPVDFVKVKFVGVKDVTSCGRELARKNFSSIVNKRMSVVLGDMIGILGAEDSLGIRTDIEKNVSEFIVSLNDIPVEKFQDFWPTLLNPSPYYFQPRAASKDG